MARRLRKAVANPFGHLPEFLQPRMRLFLSADLVGSTKLKQKVRFPLCCDGDSLEQLMPNWLSPITDFYRLLDNSFTGEIRAFASQYKRVTETDFTSRPVIWKANGDELIYTVNLNSVRDAVYLIALWVRALRNLANTKIKAAAWVAGFPIGNSEVVLRTDTGSGGDEIWDDLEALRHFGLLDLWYRGDKFQKGLSLDFIGPTIDTGFRIASQATEGKVMLSPEVALMLTSVAASQDVCDVAKIDVNDLTVRYDGRRSLKGVLDDIPYPLFWLDLQYADDLAKAERELVLGQEKEKIRQFCERFFSLNKDRILRPFIAGCPDDSFSRPPADYLPHLNKVADIWKKQKVLIDERVNSGAKMAPSAKTNKKLPPEYKSELWRFLSFGSDAALTPPNMVVGPGSSDIE